MRAVIFSPPGAIEDLVVSELEDPRPARGEILVRNFATALNRADLLQRRGLYPPPPGASDILGLEFAGEIAALGDGVDDCAIGDPVFGLLSGGGYAEFVAVDRRLALAVPENLSYDAAAAVPEAFFTAYECLFTLGGLESGDVVLIHAGASGVGSAAIQLARVFGARVLATAGSDAKRAKCLELGAELAIDYRSEDFSAVVENATAGRGVDVILDLVGAKHWDRNLRSLATRGRLLVVGLVGGSRVEVDLAKILTRRLQIIGNAMRGQSLDEKIAITARFRERVLPLLERGDVRPVLDCVMPIEDVQEAHRRMEANLNIGKIVLRL